MLSLELYNAYTVQCMCQSRAHSCVCILMHDLTFQIFGPVQCVLKFKTLNEAIERANNTSYGLAAGIVTKDLNTAIMFAQCVEAGSVW